MIHILLDTEAFRHENLHFGSKRFRQLIKFVAEDEVAVYVTDVIIGEVRKEIDLAVARAFEALPRKARAALGVLVQTDKAGLSGLLNLPDQSVLATKLYARFDQVLRDLRAVTIPSDEISISELLERYFGSLPPFSAQATKKHEFPDALITLAAERHAKVTGHRLYVVTADKGIVEAARLAANLEPVETLATMITLVHETAGATARIAKAAEKSFAQLTPQIVARVKELFEASGIYVEDEWNGEVEDVEVSGIDLGEPTIDEIDGTTVNLGFEAAISFAAEVTVGNPDQTARDPETGDPMVFGYLTEHIEATEYVEGNVTLEVNKADSGRSAISEVYIFADNVSVRFPWPC